MSTNYDINYDDSRFTQVESDKNAALSDLEKTYAGMINNSDKYYDNQIQASKDWADKQSQLQQEKTDFAIEQIEQNKAQAKKDYTKEQSGAYVDWQKQSNQYGANAEQMAAGGMTNTGFSESSQVSMYNTYQNRVATARESYNLAIQNYNNSITEARLQNNSVLAEIAYEALQAQLKLSLEGFQYKNQLILEKTNKKTDLENQYYNRYQDVLKQINTENALAEEIRQYNEKMAEEKRQYNETLALQKAQLEEEKRQFDANFSRYSGGGGSSSGGGGSKSSSSSSYTPTKTASTSSKSNSTSTMSDVTKKSILDAGLGPASQKGVADAVASGKVNTYKDTKGNTVVTKAPVTSAITGGPVMSNPNYKSTTGGKIVSAVESGVKKAVNWFKGLFD